MDEPAMAHIASDVVDLTEVTLAGLRGVPASTRSRRLLDEVRRGRSQALGGGGSPEPGEPPGEN
ncbi:hypothetical protein GCM10022245_35890 [Streptomyces mayteni]